MIVLDEFRKPFEYEEETGAIWPVRIFCIMLLSIEMFFSIIYVFQLNEFLGSVPVAGTISRVLTFLFIVYILVTLIFLLKVEKHAIKIAKSFLIARLVYIIPSVIVVFLYTINDKSAIGSGNGKFQSVTDIIFMLLVTPLLYTLVFSISWYIYFTKSKRVKESYEEVLRDDDN